MLAMMGNVTLFTLDKAIGDLGSSRSQDGYRLWMSYSKLANQEYMPRPDQPETLAERNKRLGNMWTALPDTHSLVFDTSIFYLLSGLPAKNESKQLDISREESAELQELYDELVSSEKVTKAYAKLSAGIPGGQSFADHNRLSKKRVEQIHLQLENESTRMDFGYYLIAASTHPQTEESRGSDGWCLEFTSHPEMAEYVASKSNFPIIFAARTQGKAVDEAIATVIGRPKSQGAKRPQTADVIKTELTTALRKLFEAAVGSKLGRGFPRKPNSEQCLRDRGFKLKIVQLEGSSLKPEDLLLGVDKMNSKRKLWLDDLKAGLFKLVRDSEVSNGINNYISHSFNQGLVLNEQEIDNGNEHKIEEDEEPWGGISGLDDGSSSNSDLPDAICSERSTHLDKETG
ncbi:hypothetical protein DFH28DRAFT_911765 [Melampsora americana]|nr:hypothetical protein DFH28DRAFT_911765 [Melampsora americana]